MSSNSPSLSVGRARERFRLEAERVAANDGRSGRVIGDGVCRHAVEELSGSPETPHPRFLAGWVFELNPERGLLSKGGVLAAAEVP